MASVGGAALELLVSILLWIRTFTSGPDKENYSKYGYPFIREANSFSSPRGSGGVAYDYIIIGGGTAGCPLAATLSQNFSVLLLERGGTPFGNVNVSFMQNFLVSLTDTSPNSASQVFISSDGVFNSRARILGGGTCINGGFYTRASSSYIKRVRWDAKLVNESYHWIEKQIVQRPKLAPWQKALRDSLLENGVTPYNGYTFDHVYGTKVGGTIFERNGRRHTAAELLASANPEKLEVLIHATVQKIVFEIKGKKPRATGVIFKDENGMQHLAVISKQSRNEIILSSGAIGSPQLLLLSGIGPKSQLEKLNISVVLDNEFVGKGMSDNPTNAIYVPTSQPVEQSLIQTVGITKMGVYIEATSGFGQFTDSINWNHGLVAAEIGQLITTPLKNRKYEAIQSYNKRKRNPPHEAFMGGFILEKVASPLSTGHLNLLNTNVDDNPSVTFNYFSHPSDLQRCVDGVRLIEKISRSKHFKNYMECDSKTVERMLNMSVQANVNLLPTHTNDTKSLEQFCKDTVSTIWHYH
ncbi:protein HOTHEAD-like [Olea europaea var. sylvestris]|uniref:protein HOTHEAD-like n=1 Tax=Olea europaea var. sylvestris TaxID=158386 RepID=UPI000C1D22E1|nr:protein HOTHEAD-like [Olea europaea var. sylvestris]